MAYLAKLGLLVSITLFSPKISFLVEAIPKVPCYFVFGDSLADNGNNNELNTIAKAIFPPYGVDFPGGPSGRFSNGRNYADIIGEQLGFTNYIPPYASVTGQVDILNGVNYASGGSGILPETGRNLGARISLDQQLQNHNATVEKIYGLLRDNRNSSDHLNKCIYTVGIGSNDYINNYFMPKVYPSNKLYTPEQFALNLIRKFSNQLTTLYNHGARKVALFGIGPLGCIPVVISTATVPNPNGGCVEEVNTAVKLFNDKLKPLVDFLNAKLLGAKFVYVDTAFLSSGNPILIGITVPNAPCCKIALTGNGKGQCLSHQIPCPSRDTYAFFDGFHPTEKATLSTAMRAYKALTPSDVYPMDIEHLTQLP